MSHICSPAKRHNGSIYAKAGRSALETTRLDSTMATKTHISDHHKITENEKGTEPPNLAGFRMWVNSDHVRYITLTESAKILNET